MTAPPVAVSVGGVDQPLSLSFATDNVPPSVIFASVLATDATTFQLSPVIDFGPNFVGSMAGIRITPTSFIGGGENFGPLPTDVHLRVGAWQASRDAISWFSASPVIVGYGPAFVVAIRHVGDSMLWIIPTARYLTFTASLAQGN